METMEQRTGSWLAWRNKGIGASDAAAVLGISPWMTPYQLWEQKTGRRKPFEGNWATERGNAMEGPARRYFEALTDLDMPPALVEHPEYPFIRASLDGLSRSPYRILEIKCPGKDDHQKAIEGKVPEKYIPQLQHQLMVTGAEFAYYFSFDGEKGVIVEVEPDPEYQKMLLEKEIHFWTEYVQKDTPPPYTDKDFRKIRDKELASLCEEYKTAYKLREDAEKRISEIREHLNSHIKDGVGIECSGIRACKQSRKGTVDYKAIPELKGVNLELYRKQPTSTLVVTIVE